eukprot:TRINITY_DN11233_c0_g2_i3.p3 TRINITY_DN11233_c0_g2~~TRINITY_DN11233_c0_g2_i3.p3  ORF type:complete len:134 (-),score=1.85 TRINITY_DN11233_c0_g2_i3:399-800(-)
MTCEHTHLAIPLDLYAKIADKLTVIGIRGHATRMAQQQIAPAFGPLLFATIAACVQIFQREMDLLHVEPAYMWMLALPRPDVHDGFQIVEQRTSLIRFGARHLIRYTGSGSLYGQSDGIDRLLCRCFVRYKAM